MRLFIGAELSRTARRHIARAMEASGMPGRGIIPPENLHITLDFLGEIDDDRIEDIRLAMLPAVAGRAPVHVSTGDTGWFGSDLLYLSISDGAKEFADIKQRLDTGLREINISFDDKPFRPHITLARRADKSISVGISPVSFDAGGITLFKSERTRSGQAYTPVAEAAFPEGRLRINRIEGGWAVCENSGGGKIDIAVDNLPFEAREGMLINKDGPDYIILEQGGAGSLSDRLRRKE